MHSKTNKLLTILKLISHIFSTCRPGQEAQKIYKAVYPMDPTQVKTKLIGYGFSILEDIDPNPDNYVCAGIIHTKTIQVGCLLRLEPNKSANVCIIILIMHSFYQSIQIFTMQYFSLKIRRLMFYVKIFLKIAFKF